MQASRALIISLIVSVVLNIVLLVLLLQKPKTTVETQYISKSDTVTIYEDRIVPKTVTRFVEKCDTFFVTLTDSIRDTVYVEIPVEHKTYSDTIKTDSTATSVKIDYHGWNASIDSVSLVHNYYMERQIITKKKHWGVSTVVGPQVGYDILNKNVNLGIGITIGFGYQYQF